MAHDFHEHREIQKAQINNVELIKARKDATILFEPPKITFDFVTIFVAFSVISPWAFGVRFWQHNRRHAKGFNELACFLAAVGLCETSFEYGANNSPPLWVIVVVPGRKENGYGAIRICGDKVNFRGSPAARNPYGLSAVLPLLAHRFIRA
jgi:hypothetical protein